MLKLELRALKIVKSFFDDCAVGGRLWTPHCVPKNLLYDTLLALCIPCKYFTKLGGSGKI